MNEAGKEIVSNLPIAGVSVYNIVIAYLFLVMSGFDNSIIAVKSLMIYFI